MKKSYQFQFSANAERDFAGLEKSFQKRILKKLKFFEKSQNPLSSAKKLHVIGDKYAFRIGDYRVIVTPKNQKTFIILVNAKF